jgi:hypothetical protein
MTVLIYVSGQLTGRKGSKYSEGHVYDIPGNEIHMLFRAGVIFVENKGELSAYESLPHCGRELWNTVVLPWHHIQTLELA